MNVYEGMSEYDLRSEASQETMEFVRTNYSMKREAQCIADAKEAKYEIIAGDHHTLVFDLDSFDDLSVFLSRVEFLRSKFGMQSLEVTESKSGNYHAVAKLDPVFPELEPIMRLAIQACMNSDWKKEMLGCLRTIHYQNGESLLFRPQHLKVVYAWNQATGVTCASGRLAP